jgi:hypothetical protein
LIKRCYHYTGKGHQFTKNPGLRFIMHPPTEREKGEHEQLGKEGQERGLRQERRNELHG